MSALTSLAAATGMAALQHVGVALANQAVASDSLVELTQVARVEPLAFIDADCEHMEALPDVMQSLQSIFTAYYLQAFQLTMNVGEIDVIKHLDRLNPNRSTIGEIKRNQLGMLSFEDRLPVEGDHRNEVISMEASSIKDTGMITESTNLSVGKIVNVEITDGKKKASIPIAIRLIANIVATRTLVNILTLGNKDQKFGERYQLWRAGQLEFIRDLVLCQDLIDEHKKNLIDDKQNMYSAILRRRTGNAASSVFSGNPSLATASNIIVISKDTASEIEGEIGITLKNYNQRKKIFDKTYLMLLAMIDVENNRVTIYHRGIPDATSASFRDIRNSNKGNGPNVSDILAAYRLGSAPTF